MDQAKLNHCRQRLLGFYDRLHRGVWKVLSEGTECQYSIDNLGYYEGEYQDIVELALVLPGFFSYGNGGTIELLNVKKVDNKTAAKLIAAQAEKAALETRLKEIKKEFKI